MEFDFGLDKRIGYKGYEIVRDCGSDSYHVEQSKEVKMFAGHYGEPEKAFWACRRWIDRQDKIKKARKQMLTAKSEALVYSGITNN